MARRGDDLNQPLENTYANGVTVMDMLKCKFIDTYNVARLLTKAEGPASLMNIISTAGDLFNDDKISAAFKTVTDRADSAQKKAFQTVVSATDAKKVTEAFSTLDSKFESTFQNDGLNGTAPGAKEKRRLFIQLFALHSKINAQNGDGPVADKVDEAKGIATNTLDFVKDQMALMDESKQNSKKTSNKGVIDNYNKLLANVCIMETYVKNLKPPSKDVSEDVTNACKECLAKSPFPTIVSHPDYIKSVVKRLQDGQADDYGNQDRYKHYHKLAMNLCRYYMRGTGMELDDFSQRYDLWKKLNEKVNQVKQDTTNKHYLDGIAVDIEKYRAYLDGGVGEKPTTGGAGSLDDYNTKTRALIDELDALLKKNCEAAEREVAEAKQGRADAEARLQKSEEATARLAVALAAMSSKANADLERLNAKLKADASTAAEQLKRENAAELAALQKQMEQAQKAASEKAAALATALAALQQSTNTTLEEKSAGLVKAAIQNAKLQKDAAALAVALAALQQSAEEKDAELRHLRASQQSGESALNETIERMKKEAAALAVALAALRQSADQSIEAKDAELASLRIGESALNETIERMKKEAATLAVALAALQGQADAAALAARSALAEASSGNADAEAQINKLKQAGAALAVALAALQQQLAAALAGNAAATGERDGLQAEMAKLKGDAAALAAALAALQDSAAQATRERDDARAALSALRNTAQSTESTQTALAVALAAAADAHKREMETYFGVPVDKNRAGLVREAVERGELDNYMKILPSLTAIGVDKFLWSLVVNADRPLADHIRMFKDAANQVLATLTKVDKKDVDQSTYVIRQRTFLRYIDLLLEYVQTKNIDKIEMPQIQEAVNAQAKQGGGTYTFTDKKGVLEALPASPTGDFYDHAFIEALYQAFPTVEWLKIDWPLSKDSIVKFVNDNLPPTYTEIESVAVAIVPFVSTEGDGDGVTIDYKYKLDNYGVTELIYLLQKIEEKIEEKSEAIETFNDFKAKGDAAENKTVAETISKFIRQYIGYKTQMKAQNSEPSIAQFVAQYRKGEHGVAVIDEARKLAEALTTNGEGYDKQLIPKFETYTKAMMAIFLTYLFSAHRKGDATDSVPDALDTTKIKQYTEAANKGLEENGLLDPRQVARRKYFASLLTDFHIYLEEVNRIRDATSSDVKAFVAAAYKQTGEYGVVTDADSIKYDGRYNGQRFALVLDIGKRMQDWQESLPRARWIQAALIDPAFYAMTGVYKGFVRDIQAYTNKDKQLIDSLAHLTTLGSCKDAKIISDRLTSMFEEEPVLANVKVTYTPECDKGGGAEPVATSPKEVFQGYLKDLDEAKKLARSMTEVSDSIIEKYTPFAKNAGFAPAGGGLSGGMDAREQKTIAQFEYLKVEGKAFADKMHQNITEQLKNVENLQNKINPICVSDLSSKKFKDCKTKLKDIIDGTDTFKKEGGKENGLIATYRKLDTTITNTYQSQYDTSKKAAAGIKENEANKLEIARAQGNVAAMQPWAAAANAAANAAARPPPPPPPAAAAPAAPAAEPDATPAQPADTSVTTVTALCNEINIYLKNVVDNIIIVLEKHFKALVEHGTADALGSMTGGPLPSIYADIYKAYMERREDHPTEAAEELTASLKSNGLIPSDALQITSMDRAVFVFVTLFIRLFAIYITEWAISRGWVHSVSKALVTYLMVYTVFVILFVGIVNFDTYRMRIVFNYVNFHANASRVFVHIAALWVFAFLVYMIMWNINLPIMRTADLSDEEQMNLMYRIEMLTTILWLIMVTLIALI